METKTYSAFIDGGRVPGSSRTSIGGVILLDGVEVARYSQLGDGGSNTDAEFQSLLYCLRLALELGVSSLDIKTDAKCIYEAFRSEYDVLSEMISSLRKAYNPGLLKALRIRTRQRFRDASGYSHWLVTNQRNLKLQIGVGLPPKYRTAINDLACKIAISVKLIPRSANTIPDLLCRKARVRSQKIESSRQ